MNDTKERIEELFQESLRLKEDVEKTVRSVVEANNATYVSSIDILCKNRYNEKNETYYACDIFSASDDYIYYTDRHHINSMGAKKLLESISIPLRTALV